MKGFGGHGKSLHQKAAQHQKDVAAAGAYLQQRREQEEAARQQRLAGNTGVPGGGEYSDDPVLPRHVPPDLLVAGVSDRGVAGQARDVRVQTIPHPFWGGQQVSILTFRVEAFDSTGDQRLLSSVEMRGEALEGFVRDGDWVRVTGRAKRGTIMATLIGVVTPTGSVVTRRSGTTSLGHRALQIFVGVLLLAIFIGIIIGWSRL